MSNGLNVVTIAVYTSAQRAGALSMGEQPHRIKFKNVGSVDVFLMGGPQFVTYGEDQTLAWRIAPGEVLEIFVPEGDAPTGFSNEAGSLWAFVASGTGSLLRMDEPVGTDHA